MMKRTTEPTRIQGSYCPCCEQFQSEWVERDKDARCTRCEDDGLVDALLILDDDRYFKRFSQRGRVK